MCSTPSCSGCICRRPGTPGTGPSPCSWRGGARPRWTDWSLCRAPSRAQWSHYMLVSVSIKLVHGDDVGGHWSLVSSGAGNVITESQSWSLSEARLTVVKPIIFRPGPRHQQRNLLRQQPRLPRQRGERERLGGTNQRWRRLHRFTVPRIGKGESDIGWPRVGQRGQSSPPIGFLEQSASLLHLQAVDVLGRAERVASLPQFSPGHRAPPKILGSYWAMQTPTPLWLGDTQWQWLRAELPRSRQISESGLRKGNFSKLYVLVEILMVARQIKRISFVFPNKDLVMTGCKEWCLMINFSGLISHEP